MIIDDATPRAVPLVNPTVATVFSDGTNRCILGRHNTGAFDGKLLVARLVVRVTGGTTTNFTLNMHWATTTDTSLTTINDTALIAGGATAVNSATRTFFYIVRFHWDSTSQQTGGAYTKIAAGVWTTWTVVGAATMTTESNFGMFATGLFSVSNANNRAVITEFTLEQP